MVVCLTFKIQRVVEEYNAEYDRLNSTYLPYFEILNMTKEACNGLDLETCENEITTRQLPRRKRATQNDDEDFEVKFLG